MISVKAEINLRALHDDFRRSVQRVLDTVSVALMGVDEIEERDIKVPGAWFQMTHGSAEELDFRSARERSRRWILASGLRDSIELLNPFLEAARKICACYALAKRSPITRGDLTRHLEAEAHTFDCLGFPKKMTYFKEKYGLDVLPPLAAEVLSINKARNCLVHRQGVVSRKDFHCDEGLLVQWQRLRLSVRGPGDERTITPPAELQTGEEVSLAFEKTSRLFGPGDKPYRCIPGAIRNASGCVRCGSAQASDRGSVLNHT